MKRTTPLATIRHLTRRQLGRRPNRVALIVTVLLGMFARASVASAQQTYFNVPNAQTAAVRELFLQSQLTLGKSGDAEITGDVGLTKYLEVGVNVGTIPLYAPPPDSPADKRSPSVLGNAQLTLELSHFVHTQIGTQQGIASGKGGDDRADYAARGFAVVRLGAEGARYGSYVFGGYAGTRSLLGPGSVGGGMAGVEIPLWEHHLKFAGDWVIGTNAESVAALGLEWSIDSHERWELAMAAQLPSPKSDNDYGFIVQISHIPIESSEAK